MEKLLQCLLFLLLSLFKGSFPSNKKALCGKKIFLINLKVTRPAFQVCILDRHHAWRSLDPTLGISSPFVKKEHFDCGFIFRSFFLSPSLLD